MLKLYFLVYVSAFYLEDKYYSEYTLEEISHILKIPAATVKSRLNRALTQLRIEIGEKEV